VNNYQKLLKMLKSCSNVIHLKNEIFVKMQYFMMQKIDLQ